MRDEDLVEKRLSIIHHALRATRRRYVIRILNESKEKTRSVRLLANQVAAWEHDIPVDQATGELYRNVYNSLSQTHLPTLADAGIIIYDSQRQTASPGRNLQLAALLVAMNRPTVDILYEPDSQRTDEGGDQVND